MLYIIYKELLSVFSGRIHPANGGVQYCGLGVTVGELILDYLYQGGSYTLIRRVIRLAEKAYQ